MTSDIAISLKDVSVDYALRHAHHYNLKRSISNLVTRRHENVEIISALREVSIDIRRGSRIGITGPNGSGKSTLLAVMAGALTPTRGEATTHGRVLALLGGPTEGLDPEQTGRENVMALGIRLGESHNTMSDLVEEIKDFSGLAQRFEHPTYTYSSGMQIRLRFSTITSMQADVLIVDEGIGAADAEFNERAAFRLQEFFRNSGTLALSSHAQEILGSHCDDFLQLSSGNLTKGE